MPTLVNLLARRAGLNLGTPQDAPLSADGEEQDVLDDFGVSIVKRIKIPYNSSSPPGLIEANTVDPWNKSGKYALGWVYFSVILLVLACTIRFYHIWTDKIRSALHQEEMSTSVKTESPATDYEMSALGTDKSTHKFFPRAAPPLEPPKVQSSVSSLWFINGFIASMRFIFYRPIPTVTWNKRMRPIVFPSPGIVVIVSLAFIFVTLYCFVPQPLYWQSIQFGSPPLAIRAGMIAVAMMPWIVGLGMKANIISLLTGIGHERLNVLHRWLAYICLFLSLVHTIPFYVTPVWDHGGLKVFKSYFPNNGSYIYGTGNAIILPNSENPLTGYRCGGTCAPDFPLPPLTTATTTQDVRAVCIATCTSIYRVSCYALLALQKPTHLLELLVGDHGDLDCLLRNSHILPELDESVADVLVDW